jgi:RNA polymerase sigma-70 factor (ECF subfamily)
MTPHDRVRAAGRATPHAPPTDEADWLARCGRDLDALESLYRRYVRRVAAFAARRCRSAEDVADVVAQTFDRLRRTSAGYDPDRGSVAAFVFTVAESEVADHHRRAARHAALVDRLRGRDLLDADDTARIEAAIDAAGSVAALGPALAALPEGEGEVLRLVARGYTPAEAAAVLAITPNAARVRLSRARARLRADDRPAAEPT